MIVIGLGANLSDPRYGGPQDACEAALDALHTRAQQAGAQLIDLRNRICREHGLDPVGAPLHRLRREAGCD